MIWLNPWAWLGAAAIAIPIAVHLIGRRKPTHLPFPTLQFIPETRLAIRRRRRVHDPWLLVLRVAIVTAAVAALAAPLVLSGSRRETNAQVTSRAIVVDASASMSRATPDGRSAADVARERSRQLSSGVHAVRIIESGRLPYALAQAIGWLEMQAGQREVVLISDLQIGSIDSTDLSAVPTGYGIRIERVQVAPDRRAGAGAMRIGDAVVDVTLDLGADSTTVSWTPRPARSEVFPVTIAADDAPAQTTSAALVQAVLASGVPAGAPRHQIALATSTAPAAPPSAPWMFEAIREARHVWQMSPAEAGSLRFAMQPPSTLVAMIDAAADGLSSARLLRSLAHAAVERPPIAELEPDSVPEPDTRAWMRDPEEATHNRPRTDASDARWLWALALVLLGFEWIVRRHGNLAEPPRAADGGRDARVA